MYSRITSYSGLPGGHLYTPDGEKLPGRAGGGS